MEKMKELTEDTLEQVSGGLTMQEFARLQQVKKEWDKLTAEQKAYVKASDDASMLQSRAGELGIVLTPAEAQLAFDNLTLLV